VVFKDFKGLWGWVLHNRQPLLTNAPGEDPRSTGVPEGHVSIERFLAVPAMIGGALVGLIAVANSSRDYTQRDVDVLDRMADLYAMAVLRMWSESELESYREHLEDLVRERTLELERINRKLQEEVSERKRNQEELRTIAEQLRALTAHMESIREEERRRIALEVHDTLGQALTGLKINLSILGKKVAGEEELEESVEAMSVLLDSTIASVREIATELRPGVLDDLGLAAALEWQLARFGEITGLEYHFAADAEESPLEKGLSIALFRIAQEALTNVARHAEATKVELSLSGSDREVILEVRDDGRGITVNEITGFDSLGILGMRERAHALGGKVSVRKGRDGGTIVKVTVPLGTSGKRSIDARKKEGEP
jgi:signal transduction histidine kinase